MKKFLLLVFSIIAFIAVVITITILFHRSYTNANMPDLAKGILGVALLLVIFCVYLLGKEIFYYFYYNSEKHKCKLAEDPFRIRMSVLYLMADSGLHRLLTTDVLKNMVNFIDYTCPDEDREDAVEVLCNLTQVKRRDSQGEVHSIDSINKEEILNRSGRNYFDISCHENTSEQIDGMVMAHELSKYLSEKERLYAAYSLLSVTDNLQNPRLHSLCVDGLRLSEVQFSNMILFAQRGEIEQWYNSNFVFNTNDKSFYQRISYGVKTPKHTTCLWSTFLMSFAIGILLFLSCVPLMSYRSDLIFYYDNDKFSTPGQILFFAIAAILIIGIMSYGFINLTSDQYHTLKTTNNSSFFDEELHQRWIIIANSVINTVFAVVIFLIWVNNFYLAINERFRRVDVAKRVKITEKGDMYQESGGCMVYYHPIEARDVQLIKKPKPQLSADMQQTAEWIERLRVLMPIDFSAVNKSLDDVYIHKEDYDKVYVGQSIQVLFSIGYYNVPFKDASLYNYMLILSEGEENSQE